MLEQPVYVLYYIQKSVSKYQFSDRRTNSRKLISNFSNFRDKDNFS